MEYDWSNILVPGSVVCASIGDFNGNKKIALFLVLYDEQNDNGTIDDKNVIALKLSTQTTCANNYIVPIDSKTNDFLDKNCVACCSKLHTLHKVSNIYKLLGVVSPNTLKRVYKVYTKFQNELNNQILNKI